MGEFVSEATRPGLNTQGNRVGQFHELWYSHLGRLSLQLLREMWRS